MSISNQDPLCVRVMRLSEPRASASVWAPVDRLIHSSLGNHPSDPPIELLALKGEPTVAEDLALQLPTQQGQVFAGESFRAYINVSNSSFDEVVKRVSLVAELGTADSSSVSILFDNRNAPIPALPPCESLEASICHPLEKPGIHVFTCKIEYEQDKRPSDEQQHIIGLSKTMKKTYRFVAALPFKIQSRVEYIGRQALVQCSLENLTGGSLHLGHASLVCPPQLKCTKLTTRVDRNLCETINLKSHDIFNLLFILEPTHNDNIDDLLSFYKQFSYFGNLLLQWRSPIGGSGQSSTYIPETTENVKLRPIELRLKSCPTSIEVEKPFQIDLECINRTDSTLNATLWFLKDVMAPLYISGTSQLTVPYVASSSKIVVNITLIAIVPGLHHLKGITLRDTNTNEILHSPETLGSILVF